MESLKHCVIATRESPLAMWQALHIQARLRAQYPEAAVELLGMTTKGDQILDRTLSKVVSAEFCGRHSSGRAFREA